MKSKSKRSKCQTGGDLMERSSTYVAPKPLETLNTLQLQMHQYPSEMFNLANQDADVLKSYYRMVEGKSMEGTTSKLKSKVKRYRERQSGGDLVSQLGYKDNSPFKNSPQLNINSSSISMEGVSIPLMGISNQTGETKLMKPNNKYKFKNTSSVTEIPGYSQGGTLDTILGAVQGIGPALGPIGAVASGVATLVPLVKDLFGGRDKTVVSASPGRYGSGGDIHIKPSKRGTFTAAATKYHMGVQEFASKVLANKEDYSPAMVKKANFARNAAKWDHQTGGDISLSSQAFQVQGNPNVTDGNSYPSLNANLDHNEVVTNTAQGSKFVFSDYLKDPSTGRSFAELAAKQEKAKGKAEKILKSSPYDEQAKSTISMSNANLNHISNLQELIANALGHRNSDGSTKQDYQTGGQMEDVRGMIMSPLNSFLGPISQTYVPQAINTPVADTPTLTDIKKSKYQLQLPYSGFNVGEFQKWYNQYRQGVTVPTTALTEDNKWGPKTSAAYKEFGSLYSDPNSPTANQVRDIYRTNMPLLTIPETTQSLSSTSVSPLSTTVGPAGIAPALPKSSVSVEQSTSPNSTTEYKTPWTLGDYFKLAELGSKAIGAFSKPEVEAPLLDRTQYTRKTFDPTQSLYRNQRSYQNTLNTLSATTPINLRRGLAGSALASRYSADNAVISQYDMMNQQARSQYEQQIGQQAQFNVQSQFRTNEINAANRAAKDAIQQNLFTSIGQFGEDLNRKRYASDIINLYRNQAPDVFDSYIKSMQRNG